MENFNSQECFRSPSSQQCQHILDMSWNSTCLRIIAWRMNRRLFFCFFFFVFSFCFVLFFLVPAHRSGSSPPIPVLSLFPLFQQCDGCLFLLLHGASQLGCQDLPSMGAVFILGLAASSGSSWMSQACNLHFSNAVVKITTQPPYVTPVILANHGLH